MNGGSVGIASRINDDVEVTIGSRDKSGNLLYPDRYRITKDKLLIRPVKTFSKGTAVRVVKIDDMERIDR